MVLVLNEARLWSLRSAREIAMKSRLRLYVALRKMR